MKSISLALLATVTLATSALAAEQDSIVFARPSFTVFHEFGSINRGTEQESFVFHDVFLSRSGVLVNFKATRNERLTVDALVGGTYWNPSFNENVSSESSLRYFAAAAPRAEISYAFGGTPSEPFLKATGGLFQYKYNEYSRNLGEYMFRTTAYPTQVMTGGLTWVDVNRASVTGLKLSQSLNQIFSHDLLISMETDQLPYYDLNLSYMAKANFKQAFKVGVGVQFARVLPIRPSITNPDVQYNRYYTLNDTTYVDNPDYYNQRLNDKPGADSAKYARGRYLGTQLDNLINIRGMSMSQALDSLSRAEGGNPTSYDNFNTSSIKPVIVASFDPKAAFGLESDHLNKNDLILYGEASILGIENQPILYTSRLQRTVAMVGFNVPTAKLLDVFAVELEWFGSRQPNSNAASQQTIGKTAEGLPVALPQPSIYNNNLTAGYNPNDWKDDDIKWSVFASRQLTKGFKWDVQVASDNARGFIYPSGRRYWAYFRSPSDWYWMMKITANI